MKKKIYNMSATCLAALGTMAVMQNALCTSSAPQQVTSTSGSGQQHGGSVATQQQSPQQPSVPQSTQTQSQGQHQNTNANSQNTTSTATILKIVFWSVGGVLLGGGMLMLGLMASPLGWILGSSALGIGAVCLIVAMCISDNQTNTTSHQTPASNSVRPGSVEELIKAAEQNKEIVNTDSELADLIDKANLDQLNECMVNAARRGNIQYIRRMVCYPKAVLAIDTSKEVLDKTALGAALSGLAICEKLEDGKKFLLIIKELLIREKHAADVLEIWKKENPEPTDQGSAKHKKYEEDLGKLTAAATDMEKNFSAILAKLPSGSEAATTWQRTDPGIKDFVKKCFEDGGRDADKWFANATDTADKSVEIGGKLATFAGLKNVHGQTALMDACEKNAHTSNIALLKNSKDEYLYTHQYGSSAEEYIVADNNGRTALCYLIDAVKQKDSAWSDLNNLFDGMYELDVHKYDESQEGVDIAAFAAGYRIIDTTNHKTIEGNTALMLAAEYAAGLDLSNRTNFKILLQDLAAKKKEDPQTTVNGNSSKNKPSYSGGHINSEGHSALTKYIATCDKAKSLDPDVMKALILSKNEIKHKGFDDNEKFALQELLSRFQDRNVAKDANLAQYIVMLYSQQVQHLKGSGTKTGEDAYTELLEKINDAKLKNTTDKAALAVKKFAAWETFYNHDFAQPLAGYPTAKVPNSSGVKTDEQVDPSIFQHYMNKEGKTLFTHLYEKYKKETVPTGLPVFINSHKDETEPLDLSGKNILTYAIEDYFSEGASDKGKDFAKALLEDSGGICAHQQTVQEKNPAGMNAVHIFAEKGSAALEKLHKIAKAADLNQNADQTDKDKRAKDIAEYHFLCGVAHALNAQVGTNAADRQARNGDTALIMALKNTSPAMAAAFVAKDKAINAAATKEALKEAVATKIQTPQATTAVYEDLSTTQQDLIKVCLLPLGIDADTDFPTADASQNQSANKYANMLKASIPTHWHTEAAKTEDKSTTLVQNASACGGSLNNDCNSALKLAIDAYFNATDPNVATKKADVLKNIQAIMLSPDERAQNIAGKSLGAYVASKLNGTDAWTNHKDLMLLFAAIPQVQEKIAEKDIFKEYVELKIGANTAVDALNKYKAGDALKFPKARDANGQTALIRAAIAGNDVMVHALISEAGESDWNGETALMRAARGNKEAIVTELVGTNKEKGKVSYDGKTALMYAIENNKGQKGTTISNEGIIDVLLVVEELNSGNALLEAVNLLEGDTGVTTERIKLVTAILNKLVAKSRETGWTSKVTHKGDAIQKLDALKAKIDAVKDAAHTDLTTILNTIQ